MAFLGIDLGGTNIGLALVDKNGIRFQKRIPTLSAQGAERVIARIAENAAEIMARATGAELAVKAVGVAAPGVLDQRHCRVVYSPNLDWHNVPLVEILEQKLGLPVCMENDANIYALGEFVFGAGGQKHDLICFTLGTGVGSGVICQGKILTPSSGWSAEIGHMVVQPNAGRLCHCGNRGCLEAYVSATGLKGMLNEALAAGAETTLTVGDDVPDLSRAAGQHDKLAREIFQQAGRYLGLGIVNTVVTTGITMIVLGGGVAAAWEFMVQSTMQQIQSSLKMIDHQQLAITISQLGGDAPLLGAAAYARWRLTENKEL
jgi:glucokinase